MSYTPFTYGPPRWAVITFEQGMEVIRWKDRPPPSYLIALPAELATLASILHKVPNGEELGRDCEEGARK